MTDIRIAFLGDSFVNGTGDETALGWAGRLCAWANREHALTYYNLGVRRDSSANLLARWQAECASRLPPGCDARLVISCGVNDTVMEAGRLRVPPQASRANLRQLLEQSQTRYRVLLVGPPPIDDAEQNTRIESLARVYAMEAERLRIPYIDLFADLRGDSVYLAEVAANDGAHPRSSGYEKMARLIAASPEWWFHNRAAACA